MESEDPVDSDQLRATLETYRKLATDFTNHDTILKVRRKNPKNLLIKYIYIYYTLFVYNIEI